MHLILIWGRSSTIIRQRVLPNVELGDDVWIWEGSIVYEVLYSILEEEAIVNFTTKFFMEVAIFIEVSSMRHRIRNKCGV